jgi:hypothetical protein
MSKEPALNEIDESELAEVTGGAGRRQPQHSNPFGFLDAPYKGLVFNIASGVGGKKLAEQMYGRQTSAADVARSTAAMKNFLVGGNKLPKGVPNLFGP